ncbi:MAG: DALR domain-containing protein, partial [Desulfomonilia bacterium]
FYEMLDRVNSAPVKAGEPRIKPLVESFEKSFDEAMSDDFNTALAVARIHELTTEINKALDESPAVSPQDKAALESAVSLISDVLGILEENPREFLDRIKRSGIDETGLTASEIEALIEERNAARKAKDFRRADEIRDTLKAKGIQLKDTPEGTIWEKL